MLVFVIILSITIFVVSVITVILMFSLKVELNMTFHQHYQNVMLSIYLLGIRLHKNEWNVHETAMDNVLMDDFLKRLITEKGRQQFKNEMQEIIQHGNDLKQLIVMIFDNINFKEIKWKTHFGTGEASSTGMLIGGIWVIKEVLNGTLHKLSHVSCQPSISVMPHYQHKIFTSEFDCMFSMKIAKAISILFKILFKLPDGVKNEIKTKKEDINYG